MRVQHNQKLFEFCNNLQLKLLKRLNFFAILTPGKHSTDDEEQNRNCSTSQKCWATSCQKSHARTESLNGLLLDYGYHKRWCWASATTKLNNNNINNNNNNLLHHDLHFSSFLAAVAAAVVAALRSILSLFSIGCKKVSRLCKSTNFKLMETHNG